MPRGALVSRNPDTIRANIVIDERGGMDRLLEAFAVMDGNVIDAGILANPDGPEGLNADVIMIDDDKKQNKKRLTVGNIAGFHEFGFGVPERSFIRSTMDEDTLLIEHEVFDQVAAIVEDGRNPKVAMSNVGQFVADRMKFTIETSRGIRPLSRQRLAQKRKIGTPKTPLINWGLMIDTLRFSVHPAVN